MILHFSHLSPEGSFSFADWDSSFTGIYAPWSLFKHLVQNDAVSGSELGVKLG